MKPVKIFPHKVGLVFQKEHFLKVLTAGYHWIGWGKSVKIFDKTKAFIPPIELNILLKNPALSELLQIVEVKDNQLVLLYQDKNFKQVLMPGKHAFWKSVMQYNFQTLDLSELEVPTDMDKKLLLQPKLIQYIRAHIISSFEKGLLVVDGKLERTLSPGTYYFWKNDQTISVLKADMRIQQMEISGQEILTKDKAALRINFHLQYKITDIEKALVDTKDVEKQLYLIMQMAIRAYIGTLTLDELLANKETIKDFVLGTTADKASALGCKTITCGIRDVILPGEVKDIMNKVLIAEKTAQANTIMRREETASTRSLLNTAKLMEDNAMLLKLKEMEYVEKIADKINSISLSGSSQIVDQLRQIFVADKN